MSLLIIPANCLCVLARQWEGLTSNIKAPTPIGPTIATLDYIVNSRPISIYTRSMLVSLNENTVISCLLMHNLNHKHIYPICDDIRQENLIRCPPQGKVKQDGIASVGIGNMI